MNGCDGEDKQYVNTKQDVNCWLHRLPDFKGVVK